MKDSIEMRVNVFFYYYLNFVNATCVTHVKSNLTCLPFKIYQLSPCSGKLKPFKN